MRSHVDIDTYNILILFTHRPQTAVSFPCFELKVRGVFFYHFNLSKLKITTNVEIWHEVLKLQNCDKKIEGNCKKMPRMQIKKLSSIIGSKN